MQFLEQLLDASIPAMRGVELKGRIDPLVVVEIEAAIPASCGVELKVAVSSVSLSTKIG